MIRERNIATNVILSIITCGIYGIYWFITITDETAYISNDRSMSGGTAFLLNIITCGIYGYYWSYKIGKELYNARLNKGLKSSSDNAILYLILSLFKLDIVNYCIMQSELNDLVCLDAKNN